MILTSSFVGVFNRGSLVKVTAATSAKVNQHLTGCPRGVMVKAIVVREFVLQSRYYVYFRTNTLGKGMNPLILPAMG